MGLKLKWFRRRITFEGIPSAPERSIRRKEHNSGVTVIGVYRQSVNYEDYIEPSRASYGEPPTQSFVTTTIRKPNTSTATSSTTANKSSGKNNVGDKIVRERPIETPPEPSYSPPKPPMRRGISKTKSTPNISTLESENAEPFQLQPLEATRSVEVLNEVTVEPREHVPAMTPRTARIDYKEEDDVEPYGKTVQKDEPEQIEHWRQQQPEFFNEILEKVNGFANTTNFTKTEEDHGSETESYDEIFQKVKAKPRFPEESLTMSKPETKVENSYEKEYSRHTSSSSIEEIFEPRPPEYIFAISMEEEPTNSSTSQPEIVPTTPEPVPRSRVEIVPQSDVSEESPKPLKSILKKRAPAPPPQQPQPTEVTVVPTEIPIPPPRAIRKQPEPTPKQPSPKVSDDDDDDYDNWNMVERHRSSITHTLAATKRVDPEIMRNVPASLQQTKPLLNTRAILDEEEPPRTLRGMRSRQPAPASSENTFLGLQGRTARDSESNLSEASA